MSDSNEQNLLRRAISPDLQKKVEDIQKNVPRNTGPADTLDEQKKMWLIVGICLHAIISPLLKKYIDPIVQNLYNALVANHNINMQCYRGYLRKYPAGNQYFLNYESINNNRNLPKKKISNKWMIDYQKYNYNISSHVDLSKLFLQPSMAQYSAIDHESCDSSALLGMVININTFPTAVQTVAEKIRSEIRNPWAHCDFREWNSVKYANSFDLMEKLVKHLGLSNIVENSILGELNTWKTNGQNFVSGTVLGLEIVEDIRQHTHVLSEYVQVLCTQTGCQLLKVRSELTDLENDLQKRIRHLESKCIEYEKELKLLKAEMKLQDKSHIPLNIQVQHEQEISYWEQDQNTFVEIRATIHILRSLMFNSVYVVSGSSGCGKSSTIHHVALQLRDKFDYEIIPVFAGPSDIVKFYKKNKRQVFVVDDICGKETMNSQTFGIWFDYSEKLEKIFKDDDSVPEVSGPKLLISCRLHIYKDARFQLIKLFTRKHCNLLSSEFCLLETERLLMMQKYFKENIIAHLIQVKQHVDFFPLLCKMSKEKNLEEVIYLFSTPVESIRNNFDFVIGNNNHFCALVLCILFGEFNTDWIDSKYDSVEQKLKFEDIVKEFKIDLCRELSRNTLKSSFTILDGTYLRKNGTKYRIIHDIIYTMAAVICGRRLTECFIKHASSTFIRDNVIFDSIGKVPKDVITLPEDKEEKYFERLLKDLRKGNITSTFHNKQLIFHSFVDKLIRYFKGSLEARQLLFNLNRDDGINLLFTTPLTESASGGIYHAVHFMVVCLKCEVNKTDILGCSPLYKACKEGHADIVKLLLENKCDISICNSFGMSSLFAACEGGYTEVVNILLQNKADISQSNIDGESPLYAACQGGHTNAVKLLLQNKADVSQYDNDGYSPFHMACAGGYKDILTLLLKHDVDVFHCTKSGISPFFLACKGGYTEIVKMLIENNIHDYQLNKNRESPLYVACKGGHTDTVKLLLLNKADISQCNRNGESPLYVACKGGYTATTKLLLQYKAEISVCDNDGKSPLYVVCEGGYIDTLKLLLKNNADVTKCDKLKSSPLSVACAGGHIHMVKLLLQKNSDVSRCNSDGQSPLYVACEGGHTDTVQLLLKYNADVLQCNKKGKSPLYVASERGRKDTVELLLEKGAYVSQCDDEGKSIIYMASKRGHTEIVKTLIINQANVLQCDREGKSPFYVACEGGHKDIANLLMRTNAEISKVNINGWSPLHVACKEGQTNTVKLLLSNNADVSLSNSDGESPLYLSCEGGHIDTVQLLLDNNANVSQCSNTGQSPLYVACKERHVNIVRLLLANEADVSQCEKTNGWSPLHVVCFATRSQSSFISVLMSFQQRVRGLENFETRTIAIVKLLMLWKADIEMCDKMGQTPYELAYKSKNIEILFILKKKINTNLIINSRTNSRVSGVLSKVFTFYNSSKASLLRLLPRSDIVSTIQTSIENVRPQDIEDSRERLRRRRRSD